MMDFKEIMKADIKTAFMNTDEFAEEININGHIVPGILESAQVTQSQIGDSMAYINADHKLFVAEDDMKKAGLVPKIDAAWRINNRAYTIEGVTADMGILQISLLGR